MSAEQDTAMYDQPDDEGLNADAEREAEFWRTHPRDDARPDDEAAPTVRDYFPNITEEQLSSSGFRAMAAAWHEGRPDETAHRDDNDQSQCGCSACEHYELVNAIANSRLSGMAIAWQEGRDAEGTSVTTVEPNPSPDYPGTMTVTRWTPPVNPYLPREDL